jgi:pimeloyl-ACP methyl ester carboxylesterase
MDSIAHAIACADGAVLEAVEYPAGPQAPLVLLLPGLGGGIGRFRSIARSLNAQGFRCVAMNYRGAGESTTGSTEGHTLHDYANDAARVIEHFAGCAIVLGNAFGNRVARCLASDHPALVARLVLVCAGGQVAPDPAIGRRMLTFTDERLPRSERIAAAAETLFAPGNPVPEEFIEDNRTALATKLCRAAMAATEGDTWQAGGHVRMLVVQGAQDLIAVPENAEMLRARYPDRVTVRVVEHAGHAVLNEQPDEVARLIADYLGA